MAAGAGTGKKLSLTAEQKYAAGTAAGPMLVLAGPGCGKTEALVARFQTLCDNGAKPEEILAITFTRKAAREMSTRIARACGLQADRLAIGTFHAVALNIMRIYPQAFGDLARRRVMSEPEAEQLVLSVAREGDVPVDDLGSAIDRWKDDLVTPKVALEEARGKTGTARHQAERLARAYGIYQRRMREAEALDFGDIVMALVRTMRSDPKLLATLRRRYRHILVDEYQDVNKAQERLVRLLAGNGKGLWVVGDPDQAIFGFRGSDIRYILNFGKLYADFERAELTQNHRSTRYVVSTANAFIAKNQNRFGKRLVSDHAAGDAPVFHGAEDPQAEADWIARRVAGLIADGVPAEDIAILVRVAYHANWIEQALASHDVSFNLLGMTNFWGRPEVRQALNAITALTGADLGRGEGRIPEWIRDAVAPVDADDFTGTARKVCSVIARKPPKTITGQRREAWVTAMSLLAEEIRRTDDAQKVAAKIASREAIGRQTSGGVSVGTIHASKGLEWRYVFVAACEKGILPHAKNDDFEEERRLAFVAITRARERFFCTWSMSRGREETGPSVFIDELKAAAKLAEQDLGGVRAG